MNQARMNLQKGAVALFAISCFRVLRLTAFSAMIVLSVGDQGNSTDQQDSHDDETPPKSESAADDDSNVTSTDADEVSAPDSRLSLRPGKRKRLRSEKREAPELASVPGGDSSPISLPSRRARPVREPGERRVCLAADQDGKSSSDQVLVPFLTVFAYVCLGIVCGWPTSTAD